jgi:hypothetical protein
MQSDFFDSLQHDPLEAENAPHLDLSLDVIQIINHCIRTSSLSREQIIDRMNLCLRDSDKTVTKIAFNKWLSPSQANAIPFWVVSAFCWAAQTDAPYKVALQPIGRKVIDLRGDTLRELTEKRLQASEQIKQTRALEKQMQQMLEGKY